MSLVPLAACQSYFSLSNASPTLTPSLPLVSPLSPPSSPAPRALIRRGLDPFDVSVLCSLQREGATEDGASNGIGTLYWAPVLFEACLTGPKTSVCVRVCVCVYMCVCVYVCECYSESL